MLNKNSKPVYRILEGKVIACNEYEGSLLATDTVYNNRKPIYTSDDIDTAYEMFLRLCDEGYKKHMVLIADFGMKKLFENTKVSGDWNSKYSDREGFIEVTEYNWDPDLKDNMHLVENDIHILHKKFDHHFTDTIKALKYFEMVLYSPDDARMDIHKKDRLGRIRIMTLVNNREFRSTKAYRPCKLIETCSCNMTNRGYKIFSNSLEDKENMPEMTVV